MTDTRSMLYARCSFLMEWDGVSESALFLDPNPLSSDPWDTDWTFDLGKPLEAKFRAGGVWHREYERGEVYVSPTAMTGQVVT
jgi:hypothetical protein